MINIVDATEERLAALGITMIPMNWETRLLSKDVSIDAFKCALELDIPTVLLKDLYPSNN